MILHKSLMISIVVDKQAVLLAAAVRRAEVAGLKRDLEQTQGELGLMKRQLKENKGE